MDLSLEGELGFDLICGWDAQLALDSSGTRLDELALTFSLASLPSLSLRSLESVPNIKPEVIVF